MFPTLGATVNPFIKAEFLCMVVLQLAVEQADMNQADTVIQGRRLKEPGSVLDGFA